MRGTGTAALSVGLVLSMAACSGSSGDSSSSATKSATKSATSAALKHERSGRSGEHRREAISGLRVRDGCAERHCGGEIHV